jgi:DinB superfamily
MTDVPGDDKDWTWVLERRCPECGFEAGAVDVGQIPELVRGNARSWQEVLAAPTARQRPRPDIWSPLEYACHVRDVFRLYDERLALMLADDDPLFANWDQDVTAVTDRYGSQDPAAVSRELADAAEAVAASFATVAGEQWQRRGRRSDGVAFTVRTFGQYFVHDPIHHLWDVGPEVIT